jgi:hypothetical protein
MATKDIAIGGIDKVRDAVAINGIDKLRDTVAIGGIDGSTRAVVIGGIEPPCKFYSSKTLRRISSRDDESFLEFVLFMDRYGHLLSTTQL